MKKIFFSALAVMAVGAAVMGGKAYNANNNDMSELFLGGAEQVAQAEEKERKLEADPTDCVYFVCTPDSNWTEPGKEIICLEGAGSCTDKECE